MLTAPFLSYSIKDVIDKFESTLEDEKSVDDRDAWSKLPMTQEEKHTFLMETSKDPEVQVLYKKIKAFRSHLAKLDIEKPAPPQTAKPDETDPPAVAETGS